MRQGPYYNQWVDRDPQGSAMLRLPLELEEEWSKMKAVVWEDNGNGTYTLYPTEEV